MSWIKLDDQFFTHPKIIELGKDAKLVYLAGLTYCGAQLTDGRITPGAARMLLAMVEANSEAIASLVTAGLWIMDGDGYQVHDYLEHQASREEVLHVRQERSEAGKRGGARSGVVRRAKSEANEANGEAVASGLLEAKTKQIQIVDPELEREYEIAPAPTHETPPVPAGTPVNHRPDAPQHRPLPKPSADPAVIAFVQNELRPVYPLRDDKLRSPEKAYAAVATVPRSAWPQLVVGARNYAASADAHDGLPKDIHNWINDGDWEEWARGPARPRPIKAGTDRPAPPRHYLNGGSPDAVA